MREQHATADVHLLTLPAAARRLGIGLRQLRRARERGELPTYLVGGWPRVSFADVLRWLEAQRVRPTPFAEARAEEIAARERDRDGGGGPRAA